MHMSIPLVSDLDLEISLLCFGKLIPDTWKHAHVRPEKGYHFSVLSLPILHNPQHPHWHFYHKISAAKPFIKNKSLFWLCLQCSRRADFILKCMTHNFMLATDFSNSALGTLHYSRIRALLCRARRSMSCVPDSTSYSLDPKLQWSVPH